LVGFGTENGYGTYVGTSPEDSLDIKNGGTDDLIISSVSIAGDRAFTYTGPQPLRIAGLQHAFVAFYFTPTSPGPYSGAFTINSNAANFPVKTIDLRGRAYLPDGGP
jgi:hypothetical protein